VTFDEALASVLALVGRAVEVHVFDASDTPHLVASFRGTLRAGYSMTGGEPSETEAIFLRVEAGSEPAALTLDRELYVDALRHEDGSVTLRLGSVELSIGLREESTSA
jgi:hypothetical protein